ncbi:protein artemis-like [Planococcus citri]|uniref:protein artemis-like n=1 Tax=Planococcus citri TaxID=170843 RepID=UPI0031F7BB23
MYSRKEQYEKDPEKSFNGFLHEKNLDFMAIDLFTASTWKCKVFLLSHHHTDHMQGLREFVSELHRSTDKFIYTSSLTASYLEHTYSVDPKKIESLPFNKSFVVYTLPDGSDVTVTCTPAGHCPGSVMFVIEYHNKRILYTGDFRMNLSEFKESQRYLIQPNGSCKEIDSLYIDSTFALPNKMPHRDQSQDVILKVAEEWLIDATSNRKIIIDIHSCIGGEHLFVSLSKAFKTKIAVHQDEFNKFYDNITELRPYFKVVNDISDESDWLIHACRTNRMRCQDKKGDFQIRMIRPCALGFFRNYFSNNEKIINGVPCVELKGGRGSLRSFFKIYYSQHSSLEELRDIVKFVAPSNVYLNTVYRGHEDTMKAALLISESNSKSKKSLESGDGVKIGVQNGCNSSIDEYYKSKRRRTDILKTLNLLDD